MSANAARERKHVVVLASADVGRALRTARAVGLEAACCCGAAAAGLQLDGIGAWTSLQKLCTDPSAGFVSMLTFHLSSTPFTCLFMLGAMLARGIFYDKNPAGSVRHSVSPRHLLTLLSSYLAMMALMMAGQSIATSAQNSPGTMVVGAFAGAFAFTAVSSLLRALTFSPPSQSGLRGRGLAYTDRKVGRIGIKSPR